MARPKQEDLPKMEGEGVAQKRILALDVLADKYVEARDERMALGEKEKIAKANLIAKMDELGITEYRYGDHKVQILPGKENVKVKNVDGDIEEDPEAGSSE